MQAVSFLCAFDCELTPICPQIYTPISFKYSPEQAFVRALVQKEMTSKVAKKPELVSKRAFPAAWQYSSWC